MESTEKRKGISNRTKKIAGAGLVVLLATGGAYGALSLYSQGNTTETNLAAATWEIELNGQVITSDSPTINIGDFTGLLPGDSAITQAIFKNKGSAPVNIRVDQTKSSATGDLVPFINTFAIQGDSNPENPDYSDNRIDYQFPTHYAVGDPRDLGGMGFWTVPLADLTTAPNAESVVVNPGETFAFNISYGVKAGDSWDVATGWANPVSAEDISGLTANAVIGFLITQVGSDYKYAPGIDPSLIPVL